MAIKAADQVSIVDITDAYSILLTSEAVTFMATNDSTLGSQQTVTTTVVAYRGDTALAPTIGSITPPTGITVSVGTATTAGCTLTITAASTLASGGEISIPVTVDGDVTITKKFSYAIAFKGTTGGQGSTGPAGVSMRNRGTWASSVSYLSGVTGEQYIDVVTLDGASYMCKSSHTSSTQRKPPNTTYWSVIAEKGAQGEQGIQGIQGDTGPAGEDALTLSITSSAGTIFKNSSIATTLTAHVYQGGVELNSLPSGTSVKWYKDGGSTPVATGQTLTISAGDVQNKVTYIAQLEG